MPPAVCSSASVASWLWRRVPRAQDDLLVPCCRSPGRRQGDRTLTRKTPTRSPTSRSSRPPAREVLVARTRVDVALERSSATARRLVVGMDGDVGGQFPHGRI